MSGNSFLKNVTSYDYYTDSAGSTAVLKYRPSNYQIRVRFGCNEAAPGNWQEQIEQTLVDSLIEPKAPEGSILYTKFENGILKKTVGAVA